MKVIKRINNNSVMCLDSRGRTVVAFGKGIAFAVRKGSDELPLSAIERTFYDVDEHYLALLDELSPEVLSLAADVVSTTAPLLTYELSPHAAFALADHLSFALRRVRSGMLVKMPLAYDVAQMYPVEYRAGLRTLELVREKLNVRLPKDEVAGIALCFVNAAFAPVASGDISQEAVEDDAIIEAVSCMIERGCEARVDRDSFEFARFATHMHYLIDRIRSGKPAALSDAGDLYRVARESSTQMATCLDEVCAYLQDCLGSEISDDEKLYVLLHMSRIAGRSR